MSSYDARLGLPDQPQLPLPVRVITDGSSITLHMGDALIADWTVDRVSITREERGFRIVADGEDLIVDVAEPNRFALEVGLIDPPPAGGAGTRRRRKRRSAIQAAEG